jgi:plasmid stability protein
MARSATMALQTLTVELPEGLFSQLRQRAAQANRTVEAELVDVLAGAIARDHELPAELETELAGLRGLDDPALWKLARERLTDETSLHLADLHSKRQLEGLSREESEELTYLVRQYERVMLVRARAAELLKERGHDVSSLSKEP